VFTLTPIREASPRLRPTSNSSSTREPEAISVDRNLGSASRLLPMAVHKMPHGSLPRLADCAFNCRCKTIDAVRANTWAGEWSDVPLRSGLHLWAEQVAAVEVDPSAALLAGATAGRLFSDPASTIARRLQEIVQVTNARGRSSTERGGPLRTLGPSIGRSASRGGQSKTIFVEKGLSR
jgi:hypothetical protein